MWWGEPGVPRSSLPGSLVIICCLHAVSWLEIAVLSNLLCPEFNSPLGIKISSKLYVHRVTGILLNPLTMVVIPKPAFKRQWRRGGGQEEEGGKGRSGGGNVWRRRGRKGRQIRGSTVYGSLVLVASAYRRPSLRTWTGLSDDVHEGRHSSFWTV